ncbi:MAG: hypothetical protein K9J37_13655 [Saprospiraceae bacterium]|nr:hypothetical protein [Saprospiraceae bacterium]MCF8250955.1 hypothetical protein [Saprospiraceae bacterium]MCF8281932.1 hypothetical protein [Bacteroidales bacterium]MCF8311919.1 hypothetical protein [Saprospiraceae bacterium]MCF8441927.1 hypothetical protein [Saprospiraceae bacterium]
MNVINITYHKDDQPLHDCQITLSRNISEMFIKNLKEHFEIELLQGETIETEESVTVRFSASREKLKALQGAVYEALIFEKNRN